MMSRAIGEREDFEERRQNLVMAEFAIERVPLSEELEGYLNVVTEAAKHKKPYFFWSHEIRRLLTLIITAASRSG